MTGENMMNKVPLHFQILIGMIAGLSFGYFFPGQVQWVTPLGTIFISLLKMVVIPLIFVSIIDGIARVGNTQQLSQLGFKTVAYYLVTNALAVIVALPLVNLIRPGVGVKMFGEENAMEKVASPLIDFIPENIFQAFATGNSIQIIFIAIIFGIGLVLLNQKTPNLLSWFREANALLLKLAGILIRLAPIGVFGLLAPMTHAIDWSGLAGLGKFAFTIVLSLAIHAFITLPIIFKLFSRRSILDYVKKAQPALLSAFSTSSSSATLPITLECVEVEAKVPKKVSGFVLPIGATINMDGTAIYEATACLFIAQALGVDLTLTQQIIVFMTASLAAIGAAAIPSAGLVTLTIVLSAVGLPIEGIGILLAIDRPLDMTRTVVNVWGDMVGCAVIEGKE